MKKFLKFAIILQKHLMKKEQLLHLTGSLEE